MKKIPPDRIRKIRIWTPGEGAAEIRSCDSNQDRLPLIDLASNDYLGLSNHPKIIKAANNAILNEGVGAGASRFVTGTRSIHIMLEKELASWLGQDKVFLFPSGFQANLAAVMALADRHTTIFVDKMIHYSLLVGIKASGAKLKRFSHNDLVDLETKLTLNPRGSAINSRLVITESLFSMEGTSPNLKQIADICEKHEAMLLVDEAHALGVMGPAGKGLSNPLSKRVTMITGTFGKAFGSGGAFVACNNEIGEHILQTSGAFRYTTALAPTLAAAALASLNLIQQNPNWGLFLQKQALYWRSKLASYGWIPPLGNGPILSLIVGSDKRALDYQNHLELSGLATIAIRPPTVPEGTARLRVVLRRDLPKGTLMKLIHALEKKK